MKKITLSERPDDYGFYYGSIKHEGRVYSITVLPPEKLWAGHSKLEGYEPDPFDWILFVDGEEIDRVRERSAVEEAVQTTLLNLLKG